MPFVFDFRQALSEPKTVTVNPKGWRCPIKVEYVVAQAHKYDTSLSVVWRVKGTTHCFSIYEPNINDWSKGKGYELHFQTALENFRTDYLGWFRDEAYKDAEWKWEYEAQYGRLILEDEDNRSKN